MNKVDDCCSIKPYFKVHLGKLDSFKKLCERFVDQTKKEDNCLYYSFTFHDDEVYCREAYSDADGVLAHLQNVGPLLEEALKIADLTKLEIHGPEKELKKLEDPLAPFHPVFWTLEYGFRNVPVS